MDSETITGIVLAGGRSNRMGSNKALLHFAGKALLEHALDLLRPYCDKLVISGDPAVYSMPGVEVWPDEIPGQAAMIGIYSCLRKSDSERNIILTCDMPLVSQGLIEYLLQQDATREVVFPVHDLGKWEPLCAVYSKSLLNKIKLALEGKEYSLHRLIQQSNHLAVEIRDDHVFYSSEMFLNVNTPQDMVELNKRKI
jgi:molybdopterin-guanine dinucleotide biosynthesis protein A